MEDVMERVRRIAERGAEAGVEFPDFFTSAPSLAHLNPPDEVVAGRRVRVQVWREPKGWRVDVFGEAKPFKEALKARGYRFGPTGRREKKFVFDAYESNPIGAFEAAAEEAIEVSEITSGPASTPQLGPGS